MVDRIRQLNKDSHEMEQKLGRVPTNDELADAVGAPTSKVDWMMRVSLAAAVAREPDQRR